MIKRIVICRTECIEILHAMHHFLSILFQNGIILKTTSGYIALLKGKFSSGIEGALASALNHNFNWKQLRNYSLYFSFDVFKVYLSNIDSETAEI